MARSNTYCALCCLGRRLGDCLGAQVRLVYKLNTTEPIAIEVVVFALDVILPAGEIPHEVTPVHITKLIFKHKTDIVPGTWFFDNQVFAVTFKERNITFGINLLLGVRFSKFGNYINEFLFFGVFGFDPELRDVGKIDVVFYVFGTPQTWQDGFWLSSEFARHFCNCW
jgi:hypothetical protein